MTGMSDMAWDAVKDKGAQVSIACPIEMNMRHGMPPILKLQSTGMQPCAANSSARATTCSRTPSTTPASCSAAATCRA